LTRRLAGFMDEHIYPNEQLFLKTIMWLVRGLVVVGGLVSSPFAVAQTDSAMAIRVESNQVLVPVLAFDKEQLDLPYTTAGLRCQEDSAKALQKKGISVRQTPADCVPGPVLALTSRDFRLCQDGVAQTIQSVARQRSHFWKTFDNYSDHLEYSATPTAKWSTVDFGAAAVWSWSPPADESYVLGYPPPPSAKGSCHQIKVTVDRRNVTVYSRTEYCNVEHSPSDPLEGTQFGQQMESDLASAEKPKISVMAVSGLFFGDSGGMRVHLVLEFPWDSLHRQWRNGNLFATIGTLGAVYRKDGTLAARFSDQACCGTSDLLIGHSGGFGGDRFDWVTLPARYEGQIDLSPGDYNLRVILSDGKKFGRVDLPLTIDSYQDTPLALSSVALCKRFHRVDPPEYTQGILPSKFVPLVSKGIEFTPSADATFEKKRDPLFAYFEIYAPEQAIPAAAGETSAPKPPAEPQLLVAGNVAVQFQLKITNLKTGQVQIDSGLRPASEFLQSGRPVIPIVQEVATHDLPKGNYRLEVQASDSAGHHTPWHAATFAIR